MSGFSTEQDNIIQYNITLLSPWENSFGSITNIKTSQHCILYIVMKKLKKYQSISQTHTQTNMRVHTHTHTHHTHTHKVARPSHCNYLKG